MPISILKSEKFPSFTEWMQNIKLSNLEKFREEDYTKRDRLRILHEVTDLPYDEAVNLTARDIVDKKPKFIDLLKKRGNKLCALRLIPFKTGLSKLRIRGKTLKESLKWFAKQDIDPDDYRVELLHQSDILYSSVFIISDSGIWGEIIPGQLWQLAHGIHRKTLTVFFYDFKKWIFSQHNTRINQLVRKSIRWLKVSDPTKRRQLKEKVRAEFNRQGYLTGYFEFIVWKDIGMQFCDYNRILGKYRPIKFSIKPSADKTKFRGIGASPGIVQGKARVILNPQRARLNNGEILVCRMTTINYLTLMKRASGIITEEGGILSHAAIVSRELKKPCITNVRNITKKLKSGVGILLNADQGYVKILLNNFK